MRSATTSAPLTMVADSTWLLDTDTAPPRDRDSRIDDTRSTSNAAVESVMIVTSPGGHLAQLMQLRPWWEDTERTWVTFEKEDARSILAGERVYWAHHPTTRNVRNALRNSILAVRLLRRHRPDVIVSTGAGVAFPFFVVGRFMGVQTAYIEVYDRIDSASLTGRLCYRFTTMFCIQHEEQRRLYRRATMIGRLL